MIVQQWLPSGLRMRIQIDDGSGVIARQPFKNLAFGFCDSGQ